MAVRRQEQQKRNSTTKLIGRWVAQRFLQQARTALTTTLTPTRIWTATTLAVPMPGRRQTGAVSQAHGRRQGLPLHELLVPPQQPQREELQLLRCDHSQHDTLRSQLFAVALPEGGCGRVPGCSREGQQAESVEGKRAVGGIGRHPKPPPHQQPVAILPLGMDIIVDHPLTTAVVCTEWDSAVVALTSADPAASAIPADAPCHGCGQVGHAGVCGDDGLGHFVEELAESLAGHDVTPAALVLPLGTATNREETAVISALKQAGEAAVLV